MNMPTPKRLRKSRLYYQRVQKLLDINIRNSPKIKNSLMKEKQVNLRDKDQQKKGKNNKKKWFLLVFQKDPR